MYVTPHSVILQHSDQYLLEWVETGGRACWNGYTELGLPVGKASTFTRFVGRSGRGSLSSKNK